MIARAASLCGMDINMDAVAARNILAAFPDYINISNWARSSVAFCYENGIIENSDTEVNPKTYVTRAAITKMLYQLLGKANLL